MNTTTAKISRNVGRLDAVIRVTVALLLLGVVLKLDLNPIQSFSLVVLSIPTMLFALMRWDPLYTLLGISSKKDELKA
jgi:hypothetical protein